MTSCTTAVNPAGDPTKRLSDYISRSSRSGRRGPRYPGEFLTGEAKQRLVAWSEEQFLMAFVDSKRQFLKLAIAEQKAISENETNVTYELSYIDQNHGSRCQSHQQNSVGWSLRTALDDRRGSKSEGARRISKRNVPSVIFGLVRALAILILLPGCGSISTGTTPVPDDPEPKGKVLFQASFTGLNGKTVSGVGAVYLSSVSGYNIIRLNGITMPDEAGLVMTAKANGETVYSAALRDNLGTQNFSTTLAITIRWNSLTIKSSITGDEYAAALFE